MKIAALVICNNFDEMTKSKNWHFDNQYQLMANLQIGIDIDALSRQNGENMKIDVLTTSYQLVKSRQNVNFQIYVIMANWIIWSK